MRRQQWQVKMRVCNNFYQNSDIFSRLFNKFRRMSKRTITRFEFVIFTYIILSFWYSSLCILHKILELPRIVYILLFDCLLSYLVRNYVFLFGSLCWLRILLLCICSWVITFVLLFPFFMEYWFRRRFLWFLFFYWFLWSSVLFRIFDS